MRKLMSAEILALSKAIEGEMHALAMAQTSLMAISDEQLKNLTQTAIKTSETRIAGLQQFISENNLVDSNKINQ